MEKLVKYFYEIGSLRKIARSHRQRLLTDDLSDNIASHSYRVTVISWFLAKLEKADPYKTMLTALFHDTPESRSGDLNWVHKKYVKVFENEIIDAQLNGVIGEKEIKDVFGEYEKRISVESKLTKDADVLDQLLLCREYEAVGNTVAKYWMRNQKRWKDKLYSKSAKKLVSLIFKLGTESWTEGADSSKRR